MSDDRTVICEDCGSPLLITESDCSAEGFLCCADVVCDCEDTVVHLDADNEHWPDSWNGLA